MKSDLFQQHARLKSQYPGVILLLRVGDFYEAIDEDADTVARVCSLARTKCDGHRIAGFPYMQATRFLTALAEAGFQVATAEPAADKLLPGKPVIVCGVPCAEKEGTSSC